MNSRRGLPPGKPAFVHEILAFKKPGVANTADTSSKPSKIIANSILEQLDITHIQDRAGQDNGTRLEKAVTAYIGQELRVLAPRFNWQVDHKKRIEHFEQYSHLAQLDKLIREDETGSLRNTIGTDYNIKPDVTVGMPMSNADLPLLHASVSCKFTIRSDRVQNIRHEGVLLTRHRRGRQPHVVAVTCEPLPTRLAAIARGTGEIDAVYHIALPELMRATKGSGYQEQSQTLDEIVQQKRLFDLRQLPMTLADVA